MWLTVVKSVTRCYFSSIRPMRHVFQSVNHITNRNSAIVAQAFGHSPESEQIHMAAVKLENENNRILCLTGFVIVNIGREILPQYWEFFGWVVFHMLCGVVLFHQRNR